MSGFPCEVRVKGLSFHVQRPAGAADEPTVGDQISSLVQCLLCMPLIKRLTQGQKTERKTILSDVTATFKPGTTTLVLGHPGCGKVGGETQHAKCRRCCW